ncbi:MAG: DUF1428 domain-containing protein [Pseudomonadota bacterium]
MSYVQGFLIPVPHAKQAAYLAMAQDAAPFFREFGGQRIVETWGDDVPDGKQTDFKRAVQAAADETIVFSWIEYPDRATCDAAAAAMQTDERMKPPADMPFDGKRMIYAGFETIFDTGSAGTPGYVDGFVAAVPNDAKAAYLDHAEAINAIFQRGGATRAVENWGADVPDGSVTDFKRAVQAKDGETVVFSWLEWPDKTTRDAAMAAMREDAAMQGLAMPFDGSRMIFGGFTPILDTENA